MAFVKDSWLIHHIFYHINEFNLIIYNQKVKVIGWINLILGIYALADVAEGIVHPIYISRM